MSRFISPVFLAGFGLGVFLGVGLALLAVLMASENSESRTLRVDATATAGPTMTPVVTPIDSAPAMPRTVVAQPVRIGPGADFSIIGTIARGTQVNVLGRDDASGWVVINFPPGSSARGWIQSTSLEGLGRSQIDGLSVLAPTPLATAVDLPTTTAFETATAFEFEPAATAVTETPIDWVVAEETPTVIEVIEEPTPVPTPSSSNPGPTDLVMVGMSATTAGEIVVTVRNDGPGDVRAGALQVAVDAAGFGGETLTYPAELRAGESFTLATSAIGLREETVVTASVDPLGLVGDLNRANNTLRFTLRP